MIEFVSRLCTLYCYCCFEKDAHVEASAVRLASVQRKLWQPSPTAGPMACNDVARHVAVTHEEAQRSGRARGSAAPVRG